MKLRAASAVLVFSLFACSAAFSQETPPESPKATEIVSLVDRAAELINAKGKAAFSEFRAAQSEWRKGDTYLFVTDMTGTNLFNGGFPKFEGTNTKALKDSTGKPVTQAQIDLIENKGGGWVSYMWPKAGQTQPLQKWSYVKAVNVNGAPAYVGAGFYLQ